MRHVLSPDRLAPRESLVPVEVLDESVLVVVPIVLPPAAPSRTALPLPSLAEAPPALQPALQPWLVLKPVLVLLPTAQTTTALLDLALEALPSLAAAPAALDAPLGPALSPLATASWAASEAPLEAPSQAPSRAPLPLAGLRALRARASTA